ncbi:hypothetical protein EZV62_025384 [Acer yangbiense]|uniref:Plant thionin family protein n=1 Tax=Acer yangbiense TaxID=1000413 RepID=A0A5C7GYA9_9ROSI|nr:hypothetical protein EZV62_025384 [Acer yangbiense]
MAKTIAMLLIIALVVMPVAMINADDSPCMQKCISTCHQQLPKAPPAQCQTACDSYCHGGEGDETIAADSVSTIGSDGIVRN